MSKKFTDSKKWINDWFHSLPDQSKLLWLFILDTCDEVGFLKINHSFAKHCLGYSLTNEQLSVLSKKVIKISDDLVWVPSYLQFQYANLKPMNSTHRCFVKKIFQLLADFTVENKETKEFIDSLHTLFDPCIDPDPTLVTDSIDPLGNGNGNGKGKRGVGRKPKFDFALAYENYPRKIGKARGIARLGVMIKTASDFEDLQKAIKNYSAFCVNSKTEEKFIKHFSTFVGSIEEQPWRDWIVPQHGIGSQPTGIESLQAAMMARTDLVDL